MKPRLLDLFCGAGGAGMGYYRAGFEVVGVDIVRQPRFPFKFIQADAMTFDLSGFDAVHASPPCQGYSKTRHQVDSRLGKRERPLLLDEIRARLVRSGQPWVLENVAWARMPAAIKLCGSALGLRVTRHRFFESSSLIFAPGPCRHGRSRQPTPNGSASNSWQR